MLGQHPDMYGLPELNLFVAERVGGIMAMVSAVRPTGIHGLLRTLSQLQTGAQSQLGVSQARAWLKERGSWTSQRLFQYIQDAVAPRVCVEKSPSTVMRPEFLERMHRMFPDSQCLHLSRHPRTTCSSIYRIMKTTDERIGARRAGRTDIEGMWTRSHSNIIALSRALAPGQYIRLKGEDFLADVDGYLPDLAQWLCVRRDAEALEQCLHPERSPYSCIGPPNAPFGNDPNFLRNPYFRPQSSPPARLEGPLEWVDNAQSGFSTETIHLARRLGYR
jgi:hypothetical protein